MGTGLFSRNSAEGPVTAKPRLYGTSGSPRDRRAHRQARRFEVRPASDRAPAVRAAALVDDGHGVALDERVRRRRGGPRRRGLVVGPELEVEALRAGGGA